MIVVVITTNLKARTFHEAESQAKAATKVLPSII